MGTCALGIARLKSHFAHNRFPLLQIFVVKRQEGVPFFKDDICHSRKFLENNVQIFITHCFYDGRFLGYFNFLRTHHIVFLVDFPAICSR